MVQSLEQAPPTLESCDQTVSLVVHNYLLERPGDVNFKMFCTSILLNGGGVPWEEISWESLLPHFTPFNIYTASCKGNFVGLWKVCGRVRLFPCANEEEVLGMLFSAMLWWLPQEFWEFLCFLSRQKAESVPLALRGAIVEDPAGVIADHSESFGSRCLWGRGVVEGASFVQACSCHRSWPKRNFGSILCSVIIFESKPSFLGSNLRPQIDNEDCLTSFKTMTLMFVMGSPSPQTKSPAAHWV